MSFSFEPVGIVRSCFPEKFGIPRQPGLVREARAVVELDSRAAFAETVRGLETFSHCWVIFAFHDSLDEGWNPTVRPPRLGGSRRVGVFASRSPHRPNPIGISAVRIERIEPARKGRGPRVHVSGVDLLDGTPVLDLKPYLPYSDSFPRATAGWLPPTPARRRRKVTFSPSARAGLRVLESSGYPELRNLIAGLLSQDPRPAHQKDEFGRVYKMRLLDLDVHWRSLAQGATRVESVNRPGPSPGPGETASGAARPGADSKRSGRRKREN